MATKAQDTFTEASDTELQSHIPNTGTGWTCEGGAGIMQVLGAEDAVQRQDFGRRYAREGTDIGDDNMDVSADCLGNSTTSGRDAGVAARMTTSDFDNAYHAYLDGDGGSAVDVYFYKEVAGSRTLLDSWNGNLSTGVYYTLKLEIRSGAQKVYVDGTERCSATEADSTLQGNQYAGIAAQRTGQRIDNFLSESVDPAGMSQLLSTAMRTELEKENPSVHPVMKLELPGGDKLYASADTASTADGTYRGKVLRWGSLIRGVSINKTALELVEMEVDIDDTDAEFSKIREGSSGNQVRNSTATIYLASPNVANASWFTVFAGRIDRAEQNSPHVWTVVIAPNDLPLQRWVPKVRITQADWPNASADALGQFVPIIYGTHDSNGVTNEGMVPTYYVDSVNYSYLVAYTWIKDIKAVYADTGSGLSKLSTSDWTRSNVTKNGKRFTLIDFSSSTYDDVTVTADVDGIEGDADGSGTLITSPSDQIKHFLVNFVWGDYKTGSYGADDSAPINKTHFATTKTFELALGFEGSFYIAGDQRKGVDVLNDMLASWHFRGFWTNEGDLAILPIDFTTTTVYVDDPWLRGDQADLGQFSINESRDVIDRVQMQYMLGSYSGQYHQSLEVRDPSLTEESAENLQQVWSAARLV
ncbi:MAG: hypothetical protein GTO41_13255 [Burkholderiales bacterium]|nr:hypothetical protein [Burkholderiales bacterium]